MTTTTDTVTTLGGSTVQHGPLNDRIYLMHLDAGDLPGLLDRLDALAGEKGYGKIFAKVPASAQGLFAARGYVTEACVPRFFRGREDGCFLAKYFDPARGLAEAGLDEVLAAARTKAASDPPADLPEGFSLAPATPADAPAIAGLYREVFATYPFPIHDPAYIARTMEENFRYVCVRSHDRIVAVSSSEMDAEAETVEMTDFATHPAFRGYGFAARLLAVMENAMQDAGMKTAFTICRAASYPVNITFARAGYAYAGTLVKNTNICGSFESMNVWYKPLP